MAKLLSLVFIRFFTDLLSCVYLFIYLFSYILSFVYTELKHALATALIVGEKSLQYIP